MDEDQSPAGSEVTSTGSSGPSQERTPEQLQQEIEQTRTDLGDTVAELAAKADVKAQAKEAVSDVKANLAATTSEIRDTLTAKREEAASAARAATPDSAGQAGERIAEQARRNRVPLIVLGAFAAGLLIGIRLGR